MLDKEQQIRARAHAIWEQEGRPDGHDQEHWERAAREIDGRDAGSPADGGVPGSIGSASGLQPGGTTPGGSPAAGVGSMGTGGGSTAGASTGNAD